MIRPPSIERRGKRARDAADKAAVEADRQDTLGQVCMPPGTDIAKPFKQGRADGIGVARDRQGADHVVGDVSELPPQKSLTVRQVDVGNAHLVQ